MFSRRAASTQPSFAASEALCQQSCASSSHCTNTKVGVRDMHVGAGGLSTASMNSKFGGAEAAGDMPLWLHNSTSCSSLKASSSAREQGLFEDKVSMTTARCSSCARPEISSRVRWPPLRSIDSNDKATCVGLCAGLCDKVCSEGTSPRCACLYVTLHVMFARRAASQASSAFFEFFAMRVEAFHERLRLVQAPKSCRRPRIVGPSRGMDISHLNSLYVSSLPSSSPCKASMSTRSPRTWQTS
mmetsp:Transcript_79850/g.224108  ORF Transcript_79850/g.224108 Transcript_79850/m.224108 type:complete len:243 (-) Transcript_79850:835-1563(-)